MFKFAVVVGTSIKCVEMFPGEDQSLTFLEKCDKILISVFSLKLMHPFQTFIYEGFNYCSSSWNGKGN